MNARHLISFLAANAASFTIAGAAVGLIDDFSGDLSAYTLTKMLDQNAGTSNVGFAISGGRLLTTSTGTTGAEQVLFLRDDVSLGIGEMLTIDLTNTAAWDRDIGIAVSTGKTFSGLGNPAAGDVRSSMSYFEISARNNDQVLTFANDTTAPQLSSQTFVALSSVTSLFIQRSDADTFAAGYFAGATKVTVATRNFVPTTLGTAVGFYADVRANLAASPTSFDNLAIVPEPSSVLIGAIGSLLLVRRRNR